MLRGRIRLQPAQHFDAVHAGHEDVEQDEVNGIGGDELERGLAVLRELHGVAEAGETAVQQLTVFFEIVHDENDSAGLGCLEFRIWLICRASQDIEGAG